MFRWSLIAGCALWIISELLELHAGGYNSLNSSVSSLAFMAVAVGLWVFWNKNYHFASKLGVVFTSVGMALFSLVAFQTIGSGIIDDTALSQTSLFLAAGTAVTVGALMLGGWLATVSPYPKVAGYVLIAATAFTLAVAYIPPLVSMQPLSNLILAATLGWLGFLAKE